MPIDEIIRLGKLLQEPLRIRLLMCVSKGEICNCDLARVLGVGEEKLGWHTGVLVRSNLLQKVRIGKWTGFRLHPMTEDLVSTLLNTYADELHWDPEITRDSARLSKWREQHPSNWCGNLPRASHARSD